MGGGPNSPILVKDEYNEVLNKYECHEAVVGSISSLSLAHIFSPFILSMVIAKHRTDVLADCCRLGITRFSTQCCLHQGGTKQRRFSSTSCYHD
jgi:hypothetical protein